MQNLQYFILFAGAWALINGILHDIFVLKEKKPFDRDLIRLLIDGLFLLGYCFFIFKILPSFGTIIINLIALIWLLVVFI